jgi:polar amino acid transport system substrate-binding protein/glutamate/aspartate transport system substrate-binding protein
MMIRAAVAAALFAAGVSAAAADALDRVRETGTIRLAVRDDAAPMSYLRDGVPAGYTVATCARMAERLAEQLGLETLAAKFVVVEAETRFAAIAEGAADVLCGAATVTLERRETMDFSIPVFVDGASVMTLEGGPADFAALDDKRIGVRAGTTTAEALRATLARAGMQAAVVEVDDHAAGLSGGREGVFDAYFADQSILMRLAAEAGDGPTLAVSANTLSVEPQALAMARGETRLRLEVDRALSRMWRSGEMAAIFERVFAPVPPGEALRALSLLAPIPE